MAPLNQKRIMFQGIISSKPYHKQYTNIFTNKKYYQKQKNFMYLIFTKSFKDDTIQSLNNRKNIVPIMPNLLSIFIRTCRAKYPTGQWPQDWKVANVNCYILTGGWLGTTKSLCEELKSRIKLIFL